MTELLARVELLDPTRAEEVRLYEEAFYQAFFPRSNAGIRAIWLWDDGAKRLKTKIPYEDQDIFVIKNPEGQVETGFAVNTAVREFQSGAYGFARPMDERWVEVLAVFNLGKGAQKLIQAAVEKSHQVLLARNYERFYVYATCAPYSLKWNLKRGWEIVEKREKDSVVRYFLRMLITKPYQPV
jgi:hypothetical protein